MKAQYIRINVIYIYIYIHVYTYYICIFLHAALSSCKLSICFFRIIDLKIWFLQFMGVNSSKDSNGRGGYVLLRLHLHLLCSSGQHCFGRCQAHFRNGENCKLHYCSTIYSTINLFFVFFLHPYGNHVQSIYLINFFQSVLMNQSISRSVNQSSNSSTN